MNEQTKGYLNLKNEDGEVIYSIDKKNDELIITQIEPLIDVCETLTLYDKNDKEICDINMGEVVVNAITEAMEKNLGVEKKVNVSIRNNGTYRRESPKIGVNEPCPCGSGLKYKKCCKDKENANVG